MVIRCPACRTPTPFGEKCQWCGQPLPPVPPPDSLEVAGDGEAAQTFTNPLNGAMPLVEPANPVKWAIALLTGMLVFWLSYSPTAGRPAMVAAAVLAGGVAVAAAALAESIGQGTIGTTLAKALEEPFEARLWSVLGVVCGLAGLTMCPMVLGPVGMALGYAGHRLGAKQTGPVAMLLALCGSAAGVLIAARSGGAWLGSV